MKILMLYSVDCSGIGDYMVTTINSKTKLKDLAKKYKKQIIDKIEVEGRLCIQIFSPENLSNFLNEEFFSFGKKRLFRKCFTFEDIEKFL